MRTSPATRGCLSGHGMIGVFSASSFRSTSFGVAEEHRQVRARGRAHSDLDLVQDVAVVGSRPPEVHDRDRGRRSARQDPVLGLQVATRRGRLPTAARAAPASRSGGPGRAAAGAGGAAAERAVPTGTAAHSRARPSGAEADAASRRAQGPADTGSTRSDGLRGLRRRVAASGARSAVPRHTATAPFIDPPRFELRGWREPMPRAKEARRSAPKPRDPLELTSLEFSMLGCSHREEGGFACKGSLLLSCSLWQ